MISISKGVHTLTALLFTSTSTYSKVLSTIIIYPNRVVEEQPTIINSSSSAKRNTPQLHMMPLIKLTRSTSSFYLEITVVYVVADYLERLNHVDANRVLIVGIHV